MLRDESECGERLASRDVVELWADITEDKDLHQVSVEIAFELVQQVDLLYE